MPGPEHAWERPVDVRGLLIRAARAPRDADTRPLVDQLMRDQTGGAGREATRVLLDFVGVTYEHGWQPADLMHAARKKLASGGEWMMGAIIDWGARTSGADQRAPDEWCAQLAAIREAQTLPDEGDSVLRWFAANGWGPMATWREIVAVVAMVTALPRLEPLVEPPSRWPRHRADDGDAGSTGRSSGAGRPGARTWAGQHARSGAAAESPRAEHDPKMLARIRALLSKAESTEFPDEAEALTGKAQELMSRYAIDDALLDSHSPSGSQVRARRVHIDSPYASTKVQLLSAVGVANRVRVIWIGSVDMATVVGYPIDLDLVEMLYTSLLVQATRAMTEHGRGSPEARSVSFRKAFLIAYAQRIGERLAEADAHVTAGVTGAALVLARRSREVDEEFDRLFPHTTSTRTQRVNLHGWRAGRAAADRAKITQGQLAADG